MCVNGLSPVRRPNEQCREFQRRKRKIHGNNSFFSSSSFSEALSSKVPPPLLKEVHFRKWLPKIFGDSLGTPHSHPFGATKR